MALGEPYDQTRRRDDATVSCTTALEVSRDLADGAGEAERASILSSEVVQDLTQRLV